VSEHETRLRDWLALGTKAAEVDVFSALDALLAEHRAEVSALRAELADARKRYAAALDEQLAEASSARDEVLEEVATEATRRASLARRVYVGTADAPRGEGAGDALETLAGTLRASMSAPASVLPTAKVREVLKAEHDATHLTGTRIRFRQAARRLGLSLDEAGAGETPATRDPCARCGHGRICHMPGNCNACCTCPAFEPRADTRQECTCTGTCRGPEGLGKGWRCALGKEATRDKAAARPVERMCRCGREYGLHSMLGGPVFNWRPNASGKPERVELCPGFSPVEPRELATVENGLLPAPRLNLTRRCVRCADVFEAPADEVHLHCRRCSPCTGCDARADAPPNKHRFGCSVHGKRQVVLCAKGPRSIADGHWRDAEGCMADCPGCAGEDVSEADDSGGT
jgi:hypothetical protein